MHITRNNLSQATRSMEAHFDYASTQEFLGNRREARKHRNHAEGLKRAIMAVTEVTDTRILNMTADELLDALEVN